MQPDGNLEWLTLQRSKVPRRPFAVVATYSCGDEVHAFVPLIGNARGLLLRMSGRFTASDSAPGAVPGGSTQPAAVSAPALGAENP